MRVRVLTMSAAAAALAATSFALPVAHAGPIPTGPPPPPVAHNGHHLQLVASGLKTPTSFAIGGGHVFAGDGGNSEGSAPPNGGLYVLKGGAAVHVPSPYKFVAGVAWHNHALYVSGGVLTAHGPSWRLMKFKGWTGTKFTTRRLLYTAPKKFDGFNGLGFGANGRLYVGVDVGLTDGNDHGPRGTSPHVYQILSFNSHGKNLQVFARGIRQPWQMAFPKGSSSPYVTDLGQDGPASVKNPPDFILRVRAGDDFGFPKCNHTVPANCAGYAKPFRRFGPHTDLMGIGLRKSRLYLTSFLGRHAAGPGGEVFSLSTHGGALKPLITGFVAPTVGLLVHGDHLYVGELTGQVFRLKL
jgi:glucose/arabinose dehydrogenase